METLDLLQVRRLALTKAGLLNPQWTGLPAAASGQGKRAWAAALKIIERFGYLQLDTVSIAGARSHAIVLLSRLKGLDPTLPETLLRPEEPLFEYWGHEASWIPMDLYPSFAFRRQQHRVHPWWGDLIGENPQVVDRLLSRIRNEGPLRSIDMEGTGSTGWWNLKLTKKVATALWSRGDLAIRERRNFQRSYDLTERVIPESVRERDLPLSAALKVLLTKALEGHGWATTGTLASTWRLRRLRPEIATALTELVEEGTVAPCELYTCGKKPNLGWILRDDLELAHRLKRVRPKRHEGVLLSPFDPVLWDRQRVQQLFGFNQLLEIFKPASQRVYGYYCLPVLAGDALVGRYDLKAERKKGQLHVLAFHGEDFPSDRERREAQEACQHGLHRYANALELQVKEQSH